MIKIIIESIVSLILIMLGYILAINYLKNGNLKQMTFTTVFTITKKRIVYWVSSVVFVSLLIALFNTFYKEKNLIHCLKLLTLVTCMLPIAAVDIKHKKIPNQFLIIALILRGGFFAAEWIFSPPTILNILKDSVIGAILIGVFFLLILLIFKNSIGMGDIKLFAIMGLYQGLWGAINSVFFSLMVSFLISVVLLITRIKKRKDTISFGPSILLGTIIAIGLSGI